MDELRRHGIARVMVRAYGREPVELGATGLAEGRAVEVVGDAGVVAWFPAVDVFVFDEALFGELARAFAAGRERRLVELWEAAAHYRPAENCRADR